MTTTGIHSISSRSDSPEPAWSLKAYAACNLVVSGCTPKLQKFEDGSLAWKGCPTFSCLEARDECQPEFTVDNTIARCKCLGSGWNGVLCEGVVVLDSLGLPVSWDCFPQQCGNACVRQQEPPGAGIFSVCDC